MYTGVRVNIHFYKVRVGPVQGRFCKSGDHPFEQNGHFAQPYKLFPLKRYPGGGSVQHWLLFFQLKTFEHLHNNEINVMYVYWRFSINTFGYLALGIIIRVTWCTCACALRTSNTLFDLYVALIRLYIKRVRGRNMNP